MSNINYKIVNTINPFKHIKVLPTYRDNMCMLTWDLHNPNVYANHTLKILKSRDGYTDWHECDLTNPKLAGYGTTTVNDGYYYDTEFYNLGQTFDWHYKLQLIKDCKCYESAPVAARHSLSATEFATVRQILKLDMMSPDNISMFLCRPLSNPVKGISETKKLSPTINPMTGQVIGTEGDFDTSYNPETEKNVGYGKTYDGGFSRPILVKLTINQNDAKTIDRPDGHGTIDNNKITFKCAMYPRFLRGDMIIDPVTDDRYLFDEIINEEKFKGVIPLFFTGQMTLLSRNAEEYKYQLPDCCYEILNYKNE